MAWDLDKAKLDEGALSHRGRNNGAQQSAELLFFGPAVYSRTPARRTGLSSLPWIISYTSPMLRDEASYSRPCSRSMNVTCGLGRPCLQRKPNGHPEPQRAPQGGIPAASMIPAQGRVFARKLQGSFTLRTRQCGAAVGAGRHPNLCDSEISRYDSRALYSRRGASGRTGHVPCSA